MNLLPWRVRKVLSNRFPLAYHLVVNVGARGNDPAHWDRQLEATWDDPLRQWPTKVRMIEARVPREAKILDVACGTGSILRELKARGYRHLSALELSAYAVGRLRAEGLDAVQGRLPAIAFPDQTFDFVIASQVLEHVIRRHEFAREIRRVLRPGGAAWIFVPDNCLGPIDEPEHVIIYNQRKLHRFLAKHFDEVEVASFRDDNHPAPTLGAYVRRLR